MTPQRVIVAPSLLACDFSRLADEIAQVEAAGADWLHVDVMDGHFVPNLTLGPLVVQAMRRVSRVPLDVHLMLDHPERYLQAFIDAGARSVTVHVEAPGLQGPGVLEQTLQRIRALGARAGLAMRPRSPAESVQPFAGLLDLVLVMTVEPGFGGQAFMPEMLPKIRQVRGWFQGDLAVDGGIDLKSGARCREAGANVFVAGTSVFRSPSYREAIHSLRGAT